MIPQIIRDDSLCSQHIGEGKSARSCGVAGGKAASCPPGDAGKTENMGKTKYSTWRKNAPNGGIRGSNGLSIMRSYLDSYI